MNHKIQCPSGEIGRHKGFKIPRLIGVPVQFWPRAPTFIKKPAYSWFFYVCDLRFYPFLQPLLATLRVIFDVFYNTIK